MTLSAGTRLGPYEIVAPLGAGGMGEVYRANDTRLGREVAIKVLPASLANDAGRLRRFEQEARSASALNHPNIIVIHEVGASNGTSYIAMELVDGPNLRKLLNSGPLAVRKLLDVAVQIADALAKAHAAGIVHRDLKPENVVVSRDGYVKLLDFGLAKVFAPRAWDASTITLPETTPGAVMGTVGYASPEQASGKPVDFRSDQFSFGSIVYEMVTGKRAFQKDTGAQTLAAIIQDEPEPVAQVRPGTPAPLRWIVERCLAKDPDERYASTRDLARDLRSMREHLGEVTSTASGGAGVVAVGSAMRRRPGAVPIAAAMLLGAIAGWLVARRGAIPAPPKFQRLTFQRGTVVSARFGPDGHTVYYSAAWEGAAPRVFLLRPGNPESAELSLPPANLFGLSTAGEIALQLDPKPAPQGFGWIGTLARAPLSGGAPKEILQDVTQAEWAPRGTELAVVHHVAGKARLEYPIGKVLFETAGWIQGPRFSPDGTLIAFIHHPAPHGDNGSISVVDGSGRSRELSTGWATVQGLAWAPSGEIWFTAVREGVAREIHAVTTAGRLRLVGAMEGTPALLDIMGSSALVTEDDYRAGIVVFPPGETSGRQLSWFDWSTGRALSDDGKLVLLDETGEGGGPRGSVYVRPTDGSPPVRLGDGIGAALSRDGAWALTQTAIEPLHFVMVPVKAGQPHEFARSDLGATTNGAFFPDGSRFAFVGATPGHGARLYVQAVSGGEPKSISAEGLGSHPIFVSPDGRSVAATGPDQLLHLYPTGGGPPADIAGSRAGDSAGGFTADGEAVYVSRPGNPCPLDRIDLASGARTHVRDLAGADAAGVVAFGPARVTPDGRTVIAGYTRVLSTLYRVTDLK